MPKPTVDALATNVLFPVLSGTWVRRPGDELSARQRFRGAFFTHWGREWGGAQTRTQDPQPRLDQVAAPLWLELPSVRAQGKAHSPLSALRAFSDR